MHGAACCDLAAVRDVDHLDAPVLAACAACFLRLGSQLQHRQRTDPTRAQAG